MLRMLHAHTSSRPHPSKLGRHQRLGNGAECPKNLHGKVYDLLDHSVRCQAHCAKACMTKSRGVRLSCVGVKVAGCSALVCYKSLAVWALTGTQAAGLQALYMTWAVLLLCS